VHFLVVYGVSAAVESFYDNSSAASIGFKPQDNADSHNEEVTARPSDSELPAATIFQGGAFCAAGFDGEINAIE
jgi:uronate dehydrogenase